MEVHHHTHHPKKWKEYFWEFFMLFLAVFCGFLAEIQVEHYVEHQREKKYMFSLKEELEADTTKFNSSLLKVREIHPLLDSFYNNLINATNYNYIIKGKWNVYINEETVTYLPNLTTITQIKNSGNLRLIKNHDLLKRIIEYESEILKSYAVVAQTVQDAKEKLYIYEDDHCNYQRFNKSLSEDLYSEKGEYESADRMLKYDMPILTKDPIILNRFANTVVNYKGRLRGYVDRLIKAKKQATDLIEAIQQEYHFK
jgi:hypothetical protein